MIRLRMIRRGTVEMGVLGCPNLAPSTDGGGCPHAHVPSSGSVYSAIRGGGARMQWTQPPLSDVNIGHPGLFPNHPARLAESVETSHTRKDVAAEIMRRAGPVGPPVTMDSQCKYALLARYDADVYLRLPSRKGYIERIWDHAAGSLIAQEAGCIVTDIHGRELDFSRGRGLELNAGILGAPPGIHARLVDAAREVLATQS